MPARRLILICISILLSMTACMPDASTSNTPTSIIPTSIIATGGETMTPQPTPAPIHATPLVESSSSVVRIGIWHAHYESVAKWAQDVMSRTPGVTLEIIDTHSALDSLIDSSESAVAITDVVALALNNVDIALGVPSSFTDHLSSTTVCPVAAWLDESRHAELLDPSLTQAFQRDASIYGAPMSVQIPLLSFRESEDSTLVTSLSWNRLVDNASAEHPMSAIGGVGTIWLGMMEEELRKQNESNPLSTETVNPNILNGDPFKKTTLRLRRAVQERRVLAQQVNRAFVWSDLEYPSWKEHHNDASIVRSALPPGAVANSLIDVYAIVIPAPCPTSSRVIDVAVALMRDIDAIAAIGRNPSLRSLPAAPETRQVWKEQTPLLKGEGDAYDLMIARYTDDHPSISWRLLAGIVTEAIFAPDIVGDDDIIDIIRNRWQEMSSVTILD